MGFGTKVTLVVRKDALSMNKLTEMVGTDKFCFEINKTILKSGYLVEWVANEYGSIGLEIIEN